ncbi:MAG: class I fructose-bisphosphate aldolase [Gammaproteobacteria bacterium]
MYTQELNDTIQQLVVPGKGILAADESSGTIAKRFAEIHLESTEENRRAYRELLFTTPNINSYIAGVILYDETIKQSTQAGQPFPDLLHERGIMPGIKVDKGLIPLAGAENENITEGLDGLGQRLIDYKKMGARFAKWRAAIPITEQLPSRLAITANAEALARYAAICQSLGIVPIVEPEVLMDGDHTLERCAIVNAEVLRVVFAALARHQVILECMLLKPSMVVPGKQHQPQSSIMEVAQATVTVLRRTVPCAVPSINFLSGGQSPTEATAHLNAMNTLGAQPWALSFSFARALQEPCLKVWQGKAENVEAAQKILYEGAKLNSAACLGKYVKA